MSRRRSTQRRSKRCANSTRPAAWIWSGKCCLLGTSEAGLTQIAQSIRTGDAAQLARAAHVLKSSTANVGAQIASSCYRELEKMGREGRIGAAHGLFDKTLREHERAVAQLREILLEVA